MFAKEIWKLQIHLKSGETGMAPNNCEYDFWEPKEWDPKCIPTCHIKNKRRI